MRVTRCSNNYGHHHFPEKVIPLFITNLLDGQNRAALRRRPATCATGCTSTTTCRGIELVRTGGRAGEIYNIGGGTELDQPASSPNCCSTACGAGWDQRRPTSTTARATTAATRSTARKIRDRARLRAAQGRSTTGLAETVAWYRDNRAWWEPLKARAALLTQTTASTAWLVTGAGGMLGRDLLAALVAAQGTAAIGLDRAALDITDAGRRARPRSPHRPPSSSTAPPGRPSTTPSRPRRRRCGQRRRRRAPRRRLRRGRGPDAARLHRLRLRRRRGPRRTPEDAPTGAANRVRSDQARRRAGRAGDAARQRLRRAHRLALRRRRRQLRPHDDQAGGVKDTARRRRRPARPADVDGRPRRPAGAARAAARWPAPRRPVSTTAPAAARRPGATWPARRSGCSARIRLGYGRRPARRSCGRRRGRPTACWATTAGARPASSRSATGARRWPRRSRRCTPALVDHQPAR